MSAAPVATPVATQGDARRSRSGETRPGQVGWALHTDRGHCDAAVKAAPFDRKVLAIYQVISYRAFRNRCDARHCEQRCGESGIDCETDVTKTDEPIDFSATRARRCTFPPVFPTSGVFGPPGGGNTPDVGRGPGYRYLPQVGQGAAPRAA
jgi:hypothetical protein